MRRFKTAAFALCAGLLAAPALAQEPSAQPVATEEPTDVITITGRRSEALSLRDYALEFVLDIADPPSSSRGYARWQERICVGVLNAPEDGATLVADRVSNVGRELGLTAGEPGCEPNIVVIFEPDASALAGRLVEENPSLFRPPGGDGATHGLGALADFATSDAPVRWWQISGTVDWKGRTVTSQRENGLASGDPLRAAPVVVGANSHLRNSIEDALVHAYVIVDTRKIDGLGWTQLADYVAMISLAQIDPEASTGGYDSILNLFDARSSVSGLTDWDWSYLKGLYELDRRLFPRQQRGALANIVARNQRRLEQE